MKIKKLMLKNFGIYAGRQEIDFSHSDENKPIILLGGYNGRGKTTILEAILLCLYGKRSYALLETKIAYNKYLSKYINRSDTTLESSVQVVMSVEIDSVETELSVIRKWGERDNSIKEEHSVFLNGKLDEILTDDWDSQMDFFMPIGISRFFLFDGEKVSALVDDFSDEKLKQAIRSLLGIDIIEQLGDDLKTIISRNKIAEEIESNDNDARRLREERAVLEEELNRANRAALVLKSEIERNSKRLEECELLFSSSGGAMFGKQETTLQKKTSTEKCMRGVQSEIYEKLAGAAPLLMVLPLLERANATAQVERKCEILSHEINGIERLFKDFEMPPHLQDRFDDMKANRGLLLQRVHESSLSLSPSGAEQLARLCGSFPKEELESLEKLVMRKNELQNQIQDSDDYLSLEINQNNLSKVVEEMKILNRDLAKCQFQLDQLELDIATMNQNVSSINFNLERLTAQQLVQYEANDNAIRLTKYASMVKSILGPYGQRIQKMKVDALSAKVTEKFHAIIGKRNLIQNISFNSDDLSMELYDDKGVPFNRKQLSAGEQQLLSTAIVWGIVECTGQEFPMIIDTPLARLDSTHREQFVDNYIPNAGKQIIIFSTDAEIVGELETRIDKHVAKKYLLHYDETTKSTFVQEGYFA